MNLNLDTMPEIRIPSKCLDEAIAEFSELTDRQLLRAVELMVMPSAMLERQTLIAVLVSQDFTAEDVRDVLAVNLPLNSGKTLNLRKVL